MGGVFYKNYYWDKSTSVLSYSEDALDRDNEPLQQQYSIEFADIQEWVRPFCVENWPRNIQGAIAGHFAPYRYLLAIQYADGSIAQYYICGEYELHIPEDMQVQMDNLNLLLQ